MNDTDQMIARYMAEIEERSAFVAGIIEAAGGQDLSDEHLQLVNDTNKRMAECNAKLEPLLENRRIAGDSSERVAQLAKYIQATPAPPAYVEYRSAGAYVNDLWRARLGNEEATNRIATFDRAAAHQTTTDNPGLLPEQILGPIINFVDDSRPLVNAFGPRQLPSGTWSRPKITQHTSIDAQSAEKAELTSQKMTITKVPVTAVTYGGYVNVSRQDIDWTQPGIMDLIIGDLASVYAQKTEDVFGDALVAGGTAATAGTTLPTGDNTVTQVAKVVWSAAGSVYTATKGAGSLVLACSPDMLGVFGPIFPAVNPQNSQSAGFNAGNFGTGVQGAVSGITVVVSAQLATGTAFVASTAAAEVYEDRIGSLQVVEPSVLGIQVAYAGYFAPLIVSATGIQKIVDTLMGTIWDAPNQQVVGLDPPWVEGTGGGDPGARPKASAESKQDEEQRLPGQHRGLDALAAEKGHEWSSDDLSVAEKKAELEEAGYA